MMTPTSARALVRRVLLTAFILFCVTPATAGPIVLDAAGGETLNNLRALALAAHNYEATFDRFPSDYVDSAGTPILSWRVALLPFLDEDALFNQFDTAKPWNDPANLPLLSLMPDALRSPASPAGSTETDYAGAVRTGTMFEGGPGPRLGDIPDGTSNTIFFGEAIGSSIPWTQPGDITVGSCPTLGGSGFSSFIADAVPFAFVDGSVGLLSNTVNCNTLLAFLVRNDGATVDRSALLPFVVNPSAVAEPATVSLLALGLAIQGARRWGRRR
jgi:hypothetical protein